MDDLLHLDQQLSTEEKLIRDTVRAFVTDEVLPIINDHYEQATVPRHLIPKMAQLGLLGMTLPTQYGGSEASAVSRGLACQELEKGDSALRSFVSVQSALSTHAIYQYGTEQQKQHFLPAIAAGEIIACFALTEPNAGSDPASIQTTATEVTGGWQLTGQKTWITNAPFADIAIIWAKTPAGIRGFIVEKSAYTTTVIKHKLSMRASATGTIQLDNSFVSDQYYLPGTESGLVAALSCLTQARYDIAWGAMGAAIACFQISQRYTLEREQFGKPIACFQLVQKELVDMFSEIVKAQCLNLQLGRLKDQQQENHVMVSLAKRNACYHALNIARKARNLLGGNGITLDYHVIRHLTNLETVFTYEGTDNMHTLILGKYLTGYSSI